MLNAATPVEVSLAAYEQQQDAQPDYTTKQIEDVAHFIEHRLLNQCGKLDTLAARAFNLHADYMADAVDELAQGADETVAAFLGRLSLTDPTEAGIKLQEIARGAIWLMANDHFDEFFAEAQDLGWAA